MVRFEAMEKQNEYQANNEAQLRETIKQELLSSNPTPPPLITRELLQKSSLLKWGIWKELNFTNENPELYNQLNS